MLSGGTSRKGPEGIGLSSFLASGGFWVVIDPTAVAFGCGRLPRLVQMPAGATGNAWNVAFFDRAEQDNVLAHTDEQLGKQTPRSLRTQRTRRLGRYCHPSNDVPCRRPPWIHHSVNGMVLGRS